MDEERWGRRWALSGRRLLSALVDVPGALVRLVGLFGVLALALVNRRALPAAASTLRVVRWFADKHRGRAGQILGVGVHSAYIAAPGPTRQDLKACLRDPQTGRDAAWLAAFTISGVGVGALLMMAVPLLLSPVSGGPSLLVWLFSVVGLVWGVPLATRSYALVARSLLGPPAPPELLAPTASTTYGVTVRSRWLSAAARLVGAISTAAVALVLLLALLCGLVLTPVLGLGIPVVSGALDAIRSLADLHRKEAGQVLGTDIPSHYSSTPGWKLRDVRACLGDRQTYRDALWLAGHAALGAVAVSITFGLLEVVGNMLDKTNPFLSTLMLPVLVIAAVFAWMVPWTVHLFAVLARALLAPPHASLTKRVEQLTESRAATVDAQAAELRRIERDLHDGAQARLAAVGMTLGLASQTLRTDPDRAAELLEEARADAGKALAELRDLVRGIHPPVLADRGLAGGLEAVALLCPVPVAVSVTLPGRPEAPVESAMYFAAAEALANVGKHASATSGWLRASYEAGVLRVVVGDDGCGGADARRGTGLRGIERRLAAFDGTLRLDSPPGGPTEITMELPCLMTSTTNGSGSSSPKTTSSSGTA